MENKEKRLIVELSEELHIEIKTRASFRGQSIKQWIIMAVMEQIRKEEKYE